MKNFSKWFVSTRARKTGVVAFVGFLAILALGWFFETSLFILIALTVVMAVALAYGSSFRICPPEYKFVILRWGELVENKSDQDEGPEEEDASRGPGWVFVYWFLGEEAHPVYVQTKNEDPSPSSLITRDNVQVVLDIAYSWHISDPTKYWKPREAVRTRILNEVESRVLAAVGSNDLNALLEESLRIIKEMAAGLNDVLRPLGVEIDSLSYQKVKYHPRIEDKMILVVEAEKEAQSIRIMADATYHKALALKKVSALAKDDPILRWLLELSNSKEIAAVANSVVLMGSDALNNSGSAGFANLALLGLPKPSDPQKNGDSSKEQTKTDQDKPEEEDSSSLLTPEEIISLTNPPTF